MPKEETIEIRHVRGVVGEKYNLPMMNTKNTLVSRVKAISTRLAGSPQLMHLYGGLDMDKTLSIAFSPKIISDGLYIYAVSGNSPANVVKIDLETFTQVASLTLGAGENNGTAMASDGTYLYVVTYTTPTKVAKIDLSTFTEVAVLTLDAGEDNALACFINGSFLYVGLYLTAAKIVKVDLSTFTKTATLTLAAGENNCRGLYSDGLYLYCALYLSPSKIVKVSLSTFTAVSTLTLDTGENWARSIISDGTYLYCGLANSPGNVVKIDISTFSKVATITFNTGEDLVYSVFSDGTYLYAGLYISPGKVVKISLADFVRVGDVSLDSGQNLITSVFSDGSYIYIGSANRVSAKYIMPAPSLYEARIALLIDLLHSGIHNVYPANAAPVTITSGAGAYTKGNYTQIIPASTIVTTFYITGIILYDLTANTDYVVDIATGAAASESVVGTVSHMTDNANLAHECLFAVPIKVAANTRIAVRCSDGTGSLTCKVKVRYKT